jgi:hypothetical protein
MDGRCVAPGVPASHGSGVRVDTQNHDLAWHKRLHHTSLVPSVGRWLGLTRYLCLNICMVTAHSKYFLRKIAAFKPDLLVLRYRVTCCWLWALGKRMCG